MNLVLRSAHVILRPPCPTWGARLEGLRASRRTATSETEPAAILRDGAPQVGCSRLAYLMCRSRVNPRSVRLLRMRSVGLSSIRPIRWVSWNRSDTSRLIIDLMEVLGRGAIRPPTLRCLTDRGCQQQVLRALSLRCTEWFHYRSGRDLVCRRCGHHLADRH